MGTIVIVYITITHITSHYITHSTSNTSIYHLTDKVYGSEVNNALEGLYLSSDGQMGFKHESNMKMKMSLYFHDSKLQLQSALHVSSTCASWWYINVCLSLIMKVVLCVKPRFPTKSHTSNQWNTYFVRLHLHLICYAFSYWSQYQDHVTGQLGVHRARSRVHRLQMTSPDWDGSFRIFWLHICRKGGGGDVSSVL